MAPPDWSERFYGQIERARKEGSKSLELVSDSVGPQLGDIPDEVFSLRQLEELILWGNQIREVPERVRELVNLKRLQLQWNPIQKVPDIPGLGLDWSAYLRCRDHISRQHVEEIWIGIDAEGELIPKATANSFLWRELSHLPNLRRLDIGMPSSSAEMISLRPTDAIKELIDQLGVFTHLESIGIFDTQLGKIPASLRPLRQLKALNLNGARIGEIPDWIGDLSKLQLLRLGGNFLTTLPKSLADLIELKTLDLDGNPFTEIPRVVFELAELGDLHLNAWRRRPGKLKEIPGDILQSPKLEILAVSGQPIEVPPPEVVKGGLDAIKNYWRQQIEAGIDYLCEAKLIIVGEAGAGKTTLARKIKDPEYQLKLQEPSTEGIDVVRWSFPSAVRVQKDGEEELLPTEFNASIWDFGGQEIYHSTHQFFLTRRSLYVLVADDRKEDTDFNYWLHVVELLSDRSPLLIVQNEKQDRQRNIDLGSLRAHFPNLLREAFRTNLATNRGLDQLRMAVRQELERLPHIGTPLPRTWGQVRTALEDDPRYYISLDEYLSICEENGFKRREDKLQLSGYLHDLGIYLHFQDDPVLKNTVILKPKWGTDAVYRVLDDHTILDHRGRFGPHDLERIWCDPEYSSMRHELLRMMMRFQLCYQLPDTEAYIAPQLLSPTHPAYEWTQGGFVLRYDYDFMPKGILTRFIVAVNHLIADQKLVWKSGVILEREGTHAEVIEDYPWRKITVRVSGPDTRGLLAIIDDQLERIHASFPRLRYDKFLPCNCEVCQTREEPFAYPLSELKDFAEQGDMIQCRTSRKLVDAALLISEVLPAVARSIAIKARQAARAPQDRLTAEASSRKEVFVSYAWTDESTQVVDKIQEALAGHDVVIMRDKNEMQYKDSIRSFMERIGQGKSIVVVVSKNYLESKNCMFELVEIADRGDIRDRVFPIVLGDANIYDAISRLRYIKYWEQKRDELNAEMKDVGGEYLQGIREELDLYAKIRHGIAQITNILGDMNAPTLNEHQGSDYSLLIQALQKRLEE
jgi:internalin A